MGATTTTTQGTAGPQSPEAANMMRLLGSTTQEAAGQMGDLSDIAGGNFNLTPEMMQQISRLQQIMGDQGRIQMEQNQAVAMRGAEDTAIGRNIAGSTMEAVLQGTVGEQALRSADMQALGQEQQAVNLGIQLPRQDAALQIQGNQALMQRLVGGAQAGLGYDQAIRQLNQTTVSETQTPIGQQAFDLASRAGAAYFTGGMSEVAGAASSAGIPGQQAVPGALPGQGGVGTYQGPIQ